MLEAGLRHDVVHVSTHFGVHVGTHFGAHVGMHFGRISDRHVACMSVCFFAKKFSIVFYIGHIYNDNNNKSELKTRNTFLN